MDGKRSQNPYSLTGVIMTEKIMKEILCLILYRANSVDVRSTDIVMSSIRDSSTVVPLLEILGKAAKDSQMINPFHNRYLLMLIGLYIDRWIV